MHGFHGLSAALKFGLGTADRPHMGTIIEIVAVSGGGKDTHTNLLLAKHPDRFRKFISTTTRPPRPGEIDSVDYYFVDDDVYDEWEADGLFILSIEFAGARYGTLRSEVEGHGKTLIMLVVEEVAEAIKAMREADGDTVKIIVLDVDEATVRERMKARGDSAKQIEKRIAADRPRRAKMLQIADAVIVNDELDRANDELDAVIAAFED